MTLEVTRAPKTDNGVDLTISCYAGYLRKVIDLLMQFYNKEKREFDEQKETETSG